MTDKQLTTAIDDTINNLIFDCDMAIDNKLAKHTAALTAKSKLTTLVREAVKDAETKLYEGGEKKFIAMLLEHGFEVEQKAPDFALDTVLVRMPRNTITKYFDGELSTPPTPLTKEGE